MEDRRLVFRVHAIQKMFERRVGREDVHQVLCTGEVLREYPEDAPFPSRLVLGWRGDRPLHVVAADDEEGESIFVITVYEPDAGLWDPEFRRRR